MSKGFNKIIITVVIFLVTLGLLFGAYFFYTQIFVQEPLSVTLDNSELIGEYRLEKSQKEPVLKVRLNKVSNLAGQFEHLLTSANEVLTKKNLHLELSSNPNEKLVDFYQEINPVLYEALSLNNFSDLHEKLRESGLQYGLSVAKLTISRDYLYLQLEDNDNYLYCILNRDKNSFPQIINNIGSDLK